MEDAIQALLVVDPQVGLLDLEPVPDAAQLVATLRGLIARARTAEVRVATADDVALESAPG